MSPLALHGGPAPRAFVLNNEGSIPFAAADACRKALPGTRLSRDCGEHAERDVHGQVPEVVERDARRFASGAARRVDNRAIRLTSCLLIG